MSDYLKGLAKEGDRKTLKEDELKFAKQKDNYNFFKAIKEAIAPSLAYISKIFVWLFLIIAVILILLSLVIICSIFWHKVLPYYGWLEDKDLKNLDSLVTGSMFSLLMAVTIGKLKEILKK